MKRKVLSILLTVIMLASVSPCAYAAAGEPFQDVSENDWFYSGVLYAYENGLINGVAADRFDPNGATSRAMVVTILHRLEGKPAAQKDNRFQDVVADSWYDAAVAWAAGEGIVNGYSAEAFGPNDIVTREQLAAILYRYAASRGDDVTGKADLSGYTDHGKVSTYAVEPLRWANGNGLINGVTATTLCPQDGATRAQMATILNRFCAAFGKPGSSESPAGPQAPVMPETPADPETPSVPETPVDPDPPVEPTPPVNPYPTVYEGVPADRADPAAQNLFLISAHKTSSGVVKLTLELCGTVKLCGFDLNLFYDSSCYSLTELDTDCGLAVFASQNEGCVSFNYSGASNVTKHRTVLRATLQPVSATAYDSVFHLQPNEIIWADPTNGFDVIAAPYTLTYCSVD